MEGVDFGSALQALLAGERVTRAGWNGRGMWIAFQAPDEHSKMRRPYLYLSPINGDLVPWVASQSDILATDWLVVSDVWHFQDEVKAAAAVERPVLADRHPATKQLLRHFTYDHLPPHLQDISATCAQLANHMAQALPDGPELTTGLRKLLEAKDCFVRARLDSRE